MKLLNTLLIFGSLLCLGATKLNAQNVNIPDANFKAYLVGNAAINTNGDTEIQVSEASAFTGGINCASMSISDLTGIEDFVALTDLICSSNSLTSLDLSNNTNLELLNCSANSLTSLDLSNNINLENLYCNSNSLTSLNLSNNTNLIQLICYSNSLASLDVSNSIDLRTLYFSSNSVSTIDLSNNTDLLQLICSSNSLTSLDVSNNIDLAQISCFSNSLTSLDLSNNISLENLDCKFNSLANLDISNNTSLTRLDCNSNLMTNLNAANGNNTNFINFNASLNSNLNCITVDDSLYSTINWTNIDAQTSFSTNCSMFVGITEINEEVLNVYPNPVQNELFIELNNEQIIEINILDFSGKVVKSIVNNNSKNLDVSTLSQGIYVLRVYTKTGISATRFVKQ